MSEPIVYLNDRFVPASQAKLNIYDLGIVLGATLTEMTRTFRHQPFRAEEHVARLYRSLKLPHSLVVADKQSQAVVKEDARCMERTRGTRHWGAGAQCVKSNTILPPTPAADSSTRGHRSAKQ